MKNHEKIKSLTAKGVREYTKSAAGSLTYFAQAHQLATKYEVDTDTLNTTRYNLALTYLSLGQFETAIKLYKLLPDTNYHGKYEQSLCHFSLGEFEAGTKLYFNRYHREAFDAVRFPKLPLEFVEHPVLNHDLSEANVLVLNEQGFGDELLFSRALEPFSKVVKSATVQVYEEMLPLFQHSFAHLTNITFFSARSLTIEFVKEFSHYTSLGNLWSTWYDAVPTKLTPKGTRKVGSKVKIGYIDSPNKASKNSQDRSVPIKFFKQLAELHNVEFHCLSNTQLQHSFAIDHSSEIHDFTDTQRLIEEMDLVITVDTSVAHLAALTSTPMILIHNQYLDWRWKHNFYPKSDFVIRQYSKDFTKVVEQINSVHINNCVV